MIIESCCTTLEEARSAQARGADRIELCTDLSVGGLTPSHDLIRSVVQTLPIPVNVLIRPLPTCHYSAGGNASQTHATLGTELLGRCPKPHRSGLLYHELLQRPPLAADAAEGSSEARRFGRHYQSALQVGTFESFVYGKDDIEQMIEDIYYCKSVGVAGIVVGALTPEGDVDIAAMQRLVSAAAPLPVTFHRAFDASPQDPFDALEKIIDLGCTRLLTSGKAPDAWEGRDLIRQLVAYAGDRLIILAGRGVTPANLAPLATATATREFHGTKLP